MGRILVFVLCLVFTLLGSAYADFYYVSGITAPQAPYGTSEITGLSAAGENLFVVVRAETSSFTFLVRPDDGYILRQAEFAGDVPYCQPSHRQFMSGAACDPSNDLYLIGDACGAFLEIVFGGDESRISDGYQLNGVETPTGLVVDSDTVYATDWDDETLIKSFGTTLLAEYDLPPIDSPAALAEYGNNLLVASFVAGDCIYEITKEAVAVDTHSVEGLGCFNLHGAAFVGDRLYLAGACDSIFILEHLEEGIWVPEGDSIPVEVVPGELSVDFDSVSTPGWLYVAVSDSQICPAPPGVELFPPFYDLTTTAYFDYVAGVELTFTDSLLPTDYDVNRLRIFKRPSGACEAFRDITIDWVEILATLKVLMRTRSEDDEFSVFALGLDSRTPREVVELKFAYLDGVISSNEALIPPDVFDQITGLYDGAVSRFYAGDPSGAEALVNEIAALVRDTEAIPHTYDGTPGSNVAGGIISRSHTLAFSLRYAESETIMGEAAVVPEDIIIGLKAAWVTAYLEVPEGFEATDIDPLHIFMDRYAHASPDSVTVVDYDSDGQLEVRAMFLQADVEDLFTAAGPATVNLTGFIGGFHLSADAVVEVHFPQVEIMTEESPVGGNTYRVSWSMIFEGADITYTLCYSLDAGVTWEEVESGLSQPFCYWTVPDVETTTGLLRVHTLRNGNEIHVADSDLFAILRSAGVRGGTDGPADKIMLVPNPSTSGFRIQFAVSGRQPVSVSIYSTTGELVRRLADNRVMSGVCNLAWEGQNDRGEPVASGMYLFVLREGEQTAVKKMILER
jgi:hypothetical protein